MSYYIDSEKKTLEEKLRSHVVADKAPIAMFRMEDWLIQKNP